LQTAEKPATTGTQATTVTPATTGIPATLGHHQPQGRQEKQEHWKGKKTATVGTAATIVSSNTSNRGASHKRDGCNSRTSAIVGKPATEEITALISYSKDANSKQRN
jgi:hypothetical protein